MATGSSFTPGNSVEVQGAAIFGKGYEGTVLLDSTSSRQAHQLRYDVELAELVPHSTQAQVARKILADHIRPRVSSPLAWSDLRPGLLVEHRLPEVQTCWWLAIVISIRGGKAVMACPTSARSRSYTADPTHAFKVTAHWAGSSWLSAWMGPFADHYQECMYHNFSKLHPRRKAAERRNMMPDVHDAMTTSSVETVYTCTEIGPGKPQVQGSAANGGAIAQGARTPRTSRSPSCLRVKGSPARTLRGKAGKSGATAGRLATVQHAAGYGSPAPSTPTKNKAAAMSKKGAGKQATAFEQRPSGAPVSAQTWVPPAPMHAVCDSLRPSTPRRSRITDADLVMDAKLLVGSAASAPTATPSKVPLLPIGMSPAGVAPGNSMFALSPRVLEQNLTDQVGDGLQMAAAVSTAQTWQSNDLLAGQNQEEATLFRKRALDAACQGQQLSDTNLAGGSWDLGDLGDVAGDWAPTRGSMKICFDQVQESQKAQQEMECAAMQLLSLKCGHN